MSTLALLTGGQFQAACAYEFSHYRTAGVGNLLGVGRLSTISSAEQFGINFSRVIPMKVTPSLRLSRRYRTLLKEIELRWLLRGLAEDVETLIIGHLGRLPKVAMEILQPDQVVVLDDGTEALLRRASDLSTTIGAVGFSTTVFTCFPSPYIEPELTVRRISHRFESLAKNVFVSSRGLILGTPIGTFGPDCADRYVAAIGRAVSIAPTSLHLEYLPHPREYEAAYYESIRAIVPIAKRHYASLELDFLKRGVPQLIVGWGSSALWSAKLMSKGEASVGSFRIDCNRGVAQNLNRVSDYMTSAGIVDISI